MKYLLIEHGVIRTVTLVGDITFEHLQLTVGGFVQRVPLHKCLNNRHIVMYVNEDAALQGQYRNFKLGDQYIAGDVVIVAEKRDGTFINMSPHEIGAIKMLNGELISLFPTHFGYNISAKKKSE